MANKKITELPFIDTISGSSVFDNPILNTVVPVVLYGTTNQITVENYAKFINLYNAHTGSAGNTFAGPQTINNNVTINGRLTVNEIVAQYETASILFSTGSTKLGDQLTDKHEFTGSTNITGALYYNDVLVTNIDANTIEKLQQATSSLQVQTGSQDSLNTSLGLITSSIYGEIISINSVFDGVSSVTGAFAVEFGSVDSHILGISTQTGSQDLVNLAISTYTGSQNVINASVDSHILGISTQTGSQDLVNYNISIVTSSIDSHILEQSTQTGSQDLVNYNISIVTSSIDAHILKQSTQTGSQDLVNYNVSIVTSSIDSHILAQSIQTASQDLVNYNISVVTSSIDAHILGISIYTASANTTNNSIDAHILAQSIQTASQDLVNYNISVVTSSIDAHILKQATQTGSQDLVNLGISSVTGSLIGITNGLMAFTAALDSTYATDAQLYQLYQATASIQFTTASLNTQTGSQDLVNLGVSSVTGSLIGITNGLMAFTAALDTTYATDAQLYQLYQATSSIQFATASLNTQTGSQDSVNFNISVVTSSIDAHILVQATQTGSQDLVNLAISTYTGSQDVINISVDSHILGIATQTGSQDLVNLGISTFTGSLRSEVNLIEAYTASLKSALTISGTDVTFAGKITAQEFTTVYTTSSVLYQSGSTKFGNSSDDTHEFTGSKFEVFNSDTSGTMYAVVKNNRSRNAAVKTTTTNGSFIAGTSIGTDAFQYQIYDEVEGVNRVTINSQGGTTLQGAVTASQTIKVNGGFVGSQTASTSGYVNETKTITDFTTSYFLNKNSADGEGSSATTFNLTGLPAIDGTIIDVVLIVQKDATVASINTSAIFNINGSDPGISTVFASGTAAVTTIKTFRVGRFNGVWRIVGAIGTY